VNKPPFEKCLRSAPDFIAALRDIVKNQYGLPPDAILTADASANMIEAFYGKTNTLLALLDEGCPDAPQPCELYEAVQELRDTLSGEKE
jgi:hypothetical protein